jgi:hypothetical protein
MRTRSPELADEAQRNLFSGALAEQVQPPSYMGIDGRSRSPIDSGGFAGRSIKQGGLAAQQADAAASDIAALAGAAIDPEPFRPVLRGLLMTGDKSRFMSSDVAGGGGEGQAAEYRLWWPPVKIAGRYLAPYLAARDPDLAVEPTPGGVPGGVEVHAEVGAYADAAGGQ